MVKREKSCEGMLAERGLERKGEMVLEGGVCWWLKEVILTVVVRGDAETGNLEHLCECSLIAVLFDSFKRFWVKKRKRKRKWNCWGFEIFNNVGGEQIGTSGAYLLGCAQWVEIQRMSHSEPPLSYVISPRRFQRVRAYECPSPLSLTNNCVISTTYNCVLVPPLLYSFIQRPAL